jgi:hypothetical protein
MKIIFTNPHIEHLISRTVEYYLLNAPKTYKYNYLIVEGLKSKKIGFLFDLNKSSLDDYFKIKNKKIKKVIVLFEIGLWLLINKINPFNVNLYFSITSVPNNDVLYVFGRNCIGIDDINFLKEGERKIILNTSHLALFTSKMAFSAKTLNVNFFISESDLSKEYFFKKFFDESSTFIICPFTFKNKHKSISNFDNRLNRALCTGATNKFNYQELSNEFKDFYDFFKANSHHPMGRFIYENRDNYSGQIDVLMRAIGFDAGNSIQSARFNNSTFSYLKKILPLNLIGGLRLARNSLNNFKHGHYYNSFDIVKKLNEYKIVIVTEEYVGVPSIGFVEAMACGCAFIGLEHHMYKDIGLIPNKHYITYDGSINDLISKIKFYKANNHLLAEIARTGNKFVLQNFNEITVWSNFYKDVFSKLI